MKRTTSIKVTITVMALLAFLSITPNLEGVPNELGITTVSAATYPTKWTPMPNSTYRTSLKYRKASTAATAAVIGTSINKLGAPVKILTPKQAFLAATAGYVMSMYNQKNDPNVYYTFTFQYRQLSKGRYDSNGTYLGDYEIRQTLRSYKNSARTQLIYTSTTTQKTTTLMPWMF
jgi:hypothetical protein